MKKVEKLFIGAIIGLIIILSGCSKNDVTLSDMQSNAENTENVPTDNNIDEDIKNNIETIDENTNTIDDDVSLTENLSEEKPAITQSELCTDSDEGLDYNIKGTVTVDINGTKKTYTDYCRTGKFEDYVYEYHCVNDSVASENHNCLNGCGDGKCYP